MNPRRFRRTSNVTTCSARRRARAIGTGTLLVVAVMAAGCSAGSAGATTKGTVNVNQPEVRNVTLWALPAADWSYAYAAVTDGIFKKNGLDVTISTLPPPTMAGALINGSLQASTGTETCAQAILAGLPLVNVAVVGERDTHTLIARKNVRSVDQLAGQTVITQSAASEPAWRIQAALSSKRISNVQYLELTAAGAQESAFIAGQGAAIFEPADVAAKLLDEVPGSHVLLSPVQAGPSYPNQGICVSKAFLARYPRTVHALVVSAVEGARLMARGGTQAESAIEGPLSLSQQQAAFAVQTLKTNYVSNPIPNSNQWAALAHILSVGTKTPISARAVKRCYQLGGEVKVLKSLKG